MKKKVEVLFKEDKVEITFIIFLFL
jgi:hypothetical protein